MNSPTPDTESTSAITPVKNGHHNIASAHRHGFNRFIAFLIRCRLAVLLITLTVTALLGWQIQRLNFSTSIYDLMIENLPETSEHKAFKQTFGSDDIIQVVVKGPDVFEPDFFARLTGIAERLSKVKGVRRVISLPGVKKDVDPGNSWSLEKFSRLMAPVKMFQKNLVAKNHRATAITLVLEDNADTEAVIRDINKVTTSIIKDRFQWYQIGIPLVSQALVKFTRKDLALILPLTCILIAFVLYCLYRNLWLVVIPLLSVGMALTWTFGAMAWSGTTLSFLTMIVPVFVVAVGTAYCMYICAAFMEEMQRSRDVKQAVITVYREVSLPTTLAVFTTLVGLGSLLINRINDIQKFALFAGFGIASLLLILICCLPALLSLIPPTQLSRSRPSRHLPFRLGRFLNAVITLDLKYQKLTFWIVGISTLILILGIFRIRVETNPVAYFKDNTEISRHFHDIHEDLAGSFPINVVLSGKPEYYFEDPANVQKLAELQDYLQTLDKVDKTISFADYIKLVNYALNHYEASYYRLPEAGYEMSMLINNYKIMLGQDMLSRFMNPDFTRANVMLLTHMSNSRQFLETRKKIIDYVHTHFKGDLTCTVTGIGMVISQSSQHLVRGQLKSFFITMALVFSVMLILFVSGKVGLVAITANFFPIIVNFGIMGWFGIELNMATGLIASIAIGLAVDDTIHYLVRYNREFKIDLDKDRALRDTLLNIGKPILFTTITISLAFSLLLMSSFKPTAIFGLLMVITMISALFGDLVILPSLMMHVELVTAWDLLRMMPSLGGVPAGVAHELNQPLNTIKMGAEFLKTMLQDGRQIPAAQMAEVVHELNAQVDRASDIINRLQAFGERTGFAKERINLNKPVQDTIAVMRHQLAVESIHLKMELDENLPSIFAHHHRLCQMFYNLILNACEAIIRNRENEHASEQEQIRIQTGKENASVFVEVSDSGTGIPVHLQDRIFEPFFTTKESGKGKGLGLSIVHEIIRDYNGHIDIQSKKHRGSTFRITFPIEEL